MKIVIDEKIPFIKGVFEPWAEVVYCRGVNISRDTVADADALIVRTRTRCNAALLAGSRVRVVATATIGHDHLDREWLEENGIRWGNAPGCNSGSVMQYILSVILFLSSEYSLDPARLTLGVVGVGNVGSKVARAAKTLGMNVLLNDPPRQRREGVEAFMPLERLLTGADIVTLHVPLTRDGEDPTFHLIDDKKLAMMKPDALIINSARGGVIDGRALLKALKSHRLRGAALDVWEGEPSVDPELVGVTDIATPHIAGYSVDGKANATIHSVRMVAEGLGLPLTTWTPESLPQPQQPLIDLTAAGDATAVRLAAMAIEHTYRVAEDDLLFRNNTENFEFLRDNYRIRREFGSYRVRTDNPGASALLSELGFRTKD